MLHLKPLRYVALAMEAQYSSRGRSSGSSAFHPANVLRIAPIAALTQLSFAGGSSSRSSSPARDRDRVVSRSRTHGKPPVLGLLSPRKLEFWGCAFVRESTARLADSCPPKSAYVPCAV